MNLIFSYIYSKHEGYRNKLNDTKETKRQMQNVKHDILQDKSHGSDDKLITKKKVKVQRTWGRTTPDYRESKYVMYKSCLNPDSKKSIMKRLFFNIRETYVCTEYQMIATVYYNSFRCEIALQSYV